MAELRITDLSSGPDGQRRIELTWRDGPVPREAVVDFTDVPDTGDGERIRWYLEDYAEYPADPAPVIAQAAEERLARTGVELFDRVFSGPGAGIWERAADRLGEVRVEVETDPGARSGLPWELLRDPARDAPVALDAEAFVRTHRQAAGHRALPVPAGDHLRVLLVICRPDRDQDVPFRSVAGRLVRGGAGQTEGLDLDVLRPATFARLSKVLHAAHHAGRPYHVVHFDGHGTWLDVAGLTRVSTSPHMYQRSLAAPARPGQHGYLVFEDPDNEENQQLVDGPTLGKLLTQTGVPVLVLNACRSAYAEARETPGEESRDVHDRIRAYGSLAAEVADEGVPGVVAMRYNVYVVTAAQFVADLYAQLLVGRSLGQAATAARRALAADPVRQIGSSPVELQDWAVPVIYESAPLVLLRQPERAAPVIQLDTSDDMQTAAGLPRPPDAGFFGRDETLLALDRAFDTQSVVLLHAFAGAGKSSTAAEFAYWYQATGGLERPGIVLWSSFEHHFTADRLIGTMGDRFAGPLEAIGIAWAAVTDAAQRRNIVLQVLAQVPVLWIWDNVEPVAGFPAETDSAWTLVEQDELVSLLRDLAQRTRCKVLLTSRRDERGWLGDLPARVKLPRMPMRESVQLAADLAARHGASLAGADWRPLLRYAAGNPLTITVVVGQALRENHSTSAGIEAFLARLRAGEAQLEAEEDAALGRTRSLAASLSYGFARAFTDAERAQLAVLHLFRDTVDVDVLRSMGSSDEEDAVPELAGLDRGAGIALLGRATDIGLLTSFGGGYYQIHPALPWYFTTLFTTAYGHPTDPPARRAARAYAQAIGDVGHYYRNQAVSGLATTVLPILRAEESNLLHALDLARAIELWDAAIGCLEGLASLYQQTGRDSERARLVATISPEVTDPATGGPQPDREQEWNIVTGHRAQLAYAARDWPTATALLNVLIAKNRDWAATALATPARSLTSDQHIQIRNLAGIHLELGKILRGQDDPACLPHYQEALELTQRVGDQEAEAQVALSLGTAYLGVPGLLDLDQAEHWYQHSLDLRADSDRRGKADCLRALGDLLQVRFEYARTANESKPVLVEHLQAALSSYQQALELVPADDHESRGMTENQLGNVFAAAGDVGQAVRHYQRSIQHRERGGEIYGAGVARYNIALMLRHNGRMGEALHYARAALDNFQQVGSGAASDAVDAERLIAELEQGSP